MSAAVPPVAVVAKNTGSEVRITLDQWRGVDWVDIRVYAAFTAAKVPMATKKGVSLQVDRLPELIQGLQLAEQEARARGLIK